MLYAKQIEAAQARIQDLIKKDSVVTSWPLRVSGLNLKAAEFCRLAKVPQESFSRWIAGKQEPEWETIDKIEAAINKARKERGHEKIKA